MLGFPNLIGAATGYPDGWDQDQSYGKLTGITDPELLESDNKKGIEILNSELRIIHRILAINYSGKKKKAISSISKAEIFLLESMQLKRPVHLAYWITGHLIRHKTSKKMLFGALITKLAKQLQGFDLKSLTPFYTPRLLTFQSLDDMGFFNVYDTFVFCEPGFTPNTDHELNRKRKDGYKFTDLHSDKAKAILRRAKAQMAKQKGPKKEPKGPAKKKKSSRVQTQAVVQTTPLLLTNTPEVQEVVHADHQTPTEPMPPHSPAHTVLIEDDAVTSAVNTDTVHPTEETGPEGQSNPAPTITPTDQQPEQAVQSEVDAITSTVQNAREVVNLIQEEEPQHQSTPELQVQEVDRHVSTEIPTDTTPGPLPQPDHQTILTAHSVPSQHETGQSSQPPTTPLNQITLTAPTLPTIPTPASEDVPYEWQETFNHNFAELHNWFTLINKRLQNQNRSTKEKLDELLETQTAHNREHSDKRDAAEASNLYAIKKQLAELKAQSTTIINAQAQLEQTMKENKESTEIQLQAIREEQKEIIAAVQQMKEAPCPKCVEKEKTPSKPPRPFFLSCPDENPDEEFD